MRFGFTTGSCAAAAAKAAAYMLLTGKEKTEITIDTPKGIPYTAKILQIKRKEAVVSCAVEKDGGDDPDVTTGARIVATVSLTDVGEQQIRIEGGKGVGRVKRAGLDQPVGNAAINHVPREMIEKEVLEVCQLADYQGSLLVEISVPDGEKIAEKTFNSRLGIEGGISILGTSGIVEPMSSQALLDTIQVEIHQKKVLGYRVLAISPGNYGLDFMKNTYHYDLDKSVKCSNFIGLTIDMAVKEGFRKILLTGHIGKLIKVSGGIMNTHSKEADSRMELLASFALLEDVPAEDLKQILNCLSSEEAIGILKKDEAKLTRMMQKIAEKICFYLKKRAGEEIDIECILYSNEYGELAKSRGAEKLLEEIKKL